MGVSRTTGTVVVVLLIIIVVAATLHPGMTIAGQASYLSSDFCGNEKVFDSGFKGYVK